MDTPIWQLEDHVARLLLGGLQATIDLLRPSEGLVNIRLATGRLSGARALAIAVPALLPTDSDPTVKPYVRGEELAGTYQSTADRLIAVDALWRAIEPTPGERFIAAVELTVSVHTQLLDSRAELSVESIVPADETLQLTGVDSVDFRRLLPATEGSTAIDPAEGTACLLLRLTDAEFSYAEMVHPADFRHDDLCPDPTGGRAMRISHRLFAERLEKGVILPARVRGVFLPRPDDSRIAAETYASFAASGPPLGT